MSKDEFKDLIVQEAVLDAMSLMECERRFGVNRTEQLNGSAVVKYHHELVYMGLDVRLYT
jgi:hypothetical protein